MKLCPKCNRTYDDSLSFCLEDGALLTASGDSETILLHKPKRSRIWLPVAVAVLLIFVGIGVASLILMKRLVGTGQQKTVNPQKQSFPKRSPDAAPAGAESSPESNSDHDLNSETSKDDPHLGPDGDRNVIIAEDTTFENPFDVNGSSITLHLKGNNKEQFFALDTQKEVIVSFSLKAEAANAGANIAFLDDQGNELASPVLIQAINLGEEHESAKVDLPEHSKLIMKVISIAYGSQPAYPGILKVNFEPSK